MIINQSIHDMDDLFFDDDKHEYRDELGLRLLGTTEMLEDAGLIEGDAPDWALQRGKVIHALTEKFDLGTLTADGVDPQLAGYVMSWEGARAKLEAAGFSIVGVETRLFSKEDRYAGTLDRVLFHNGRKKYSVLDIKSGPYHRWHHIQVALYERLLALHPALDRFDDLLEDGVVAYLNKYGTPGELRKMHDVRRHVPDHVMAESVLLNARWKKGI